MAEAATPPPGRFITLEGGEGTGKSTQVRRLAERLRALGIDVVTTREPGGSPKAEAIREVLLSGAAEPLGTKAETLLFAAARDDHLETLIRPALAAGRWVLSDRFADSTRVYQGSRGAAEHAFVLALEAAVLGDTRPDLTLILDIDPEVGLARAAARRGQGAVDRFEGEGLDVHRAQREAFRAIAAAEPERCALIDAAGSEDEVAARIWAVVDARLQPGAGAATKRG